MNALILPILTRLALLIIPWTLASMGTSSAAESLPLGTYTKTTADLCRFHTERHEAQSRLPRNMLTALSHVESGRWDTVRQEKIAWPWTVMAEGDGRYFRTKAEAIKEVRALQAKGIRNIDVGCMQINLKHHPHAFDTLNDAFDPAINVAYAADFLTRLYNDTGSWAKAATRYHSATPVRATRYSGLLTRAWNELNSQSYTDTKSGYTGHLLDRLPGYRKAGRPLPSSGERMIYPSAQLKAASLKRTQTENIHAQSAHSRENAKSFAKDWRNRKLTEYLGNRRTPVAPSSEKSMTSAPAAVEPGAIASPYASVSAPVAFERVGAAGR